MTARPRLREVRVSRVEVERAPVAAFARNAVLEAAGVSERVLGQLLAHELSRGALGQAEPDAELDAGLERMALGRPFVALAAEVPGLVREHREGAPRAGSRRLALEGQAVEVVADLRVRIARSPPTTATPSACWTAPT